MEKWLDLKRVGSQSFVVLRVSSSPREFKCCCLPEVEQDNGNVFFVRIVGLLSSVANSEDLGVPLLKKFNETYICKILRYYISYPRKICILSSIIFYNVTHIARNIIFSLTENRCIIVLHKTVVY